MKLDLQLLPEGLSICRLPPGSAPPDWFETKGFRSLTWTQDELSIVCRESLVPPGVRSEAGWRCLMVRGPLDFGLTGVLSSLTEPLAAAAISIFAVSTFETDYLLVKEENLAEAIEVLLTAGHSVR